jgi:peptidoglycan/xylan/chitin deacetylase (PgdA/CDA1 family)
VRRSSWSTALPLLAVVAASAAGTVAVARPPNRAVSVAGSGTLYASDPDLPMVLQLRSRAGAPQAGAHVSVPILVYHYIRINPNPRDHVGFGLSTPPAVFKAEMDWLHAVGGHTVTLAQVMAAMKGGAPLPPRSVVLTFDDGHSSFVTQAMPVLLQDGFVATVFVNTGLMGRPSYMTAAQVQQAAAAGMVIGDHTVNHVDLNALPAIAVRTEISADRTVLQELTGQSVMDFAYPYGDYDAQVVSAVAALGFRDAVTMNFGRVEWLAQPFTMPRIRCGGSEQVWSWAEQAGLPVPPAAWVDPVRQLSAQRVAWSG